MNKDIRINWNVGMELLPETFIHLENQLAAYRQLLRKVQASKQFGLIPGSALKTMLSVEGDALSVGEVDCQALLEDGNMVDYHRDARWQLTLTGSSNEWYLAVWPSEKTREYELDDVPFVENEYEFGLRTLEQLSGCMPLAKVVHENGAWKLQDDYILPVIAMQDAPLLTEMTQAILQLVRQITAHEKFAYLRNHDVMRMLEEEMGSLGKNQSPRDFVTLCRRFVRLLSYVIQEAPLQLPLYNPYDIQLFLTSVCGFLIQAFEKMPLVEIVEYQAIPKQEEPEPEPEPEPEDDCPIL